MVSCKCARNRKDRQPHKDTRKGFNSIYYLSLPIGQRRTSHPPERNNPSQTKCPLKVAIN